MRQPSEIERLYIDFDCFFASVEQQLQPQLRGYPVGVLPFMSKASCVIAPSREAKLFGVKTGARVKEALQLCPDILFVPARHDIYVRLHHQIYKNIESCVHIDKACSIDEVVCTLLNNERKRPEDLARRIVKTLSDSIGPYISCSMGFAPNSLLAKIAADVEKPKGVVIWHPHNFTTELFKLDLSDIPGIGTGMSRRLENANIKDIVSLWSLSPEHLKRVWGSIEGARFWYSLHGYATEPLATSRCMFGHSRILTPEHRIPYHARNCARLLTVKAARRLRREQMIACAFSLSLRLENKMKWSGDEHFSASSDDHLFLTSLGKLWKQALQDCKYEKNKHDFRIKKVSVSIHHLQALKNRQKDLFTDIDTDTGKWDALSQTMDNIVTKYGSKAASLGVWEEPHGGYAGAKIAFGRIPSLSDF